MLRSADDNGVLHAAGRILDEAVAFTSLGTADAVRMQRGEAGGMGKKQKIAGRRHGFTVVKVKGLDGETLIFGMRAPVIAGRPHGLKGEARA